MGNLLSTTYWHNEFICDQNGKYRAANPHDRVIDYKYKYSLVNLDNKHPGLYKKCTANINDDPQIMHIKMRTIYGDNMPKYIGSVYYELHTNELLDKHINLRLGSDEHIPQITVGKNSEYIGLTVDCIIIDKGAACTYLKDCTIGYVIVPERYMDCRFTNCHIREPPADYKNSGLFIDCTFSNQELAVKNANKI